MTKPSVNLGRIGVWYGGLDLLPASLGLETAQRIEELGYGALWIAEGLGREPFAWAGSLLSATKTMPIATGIASIYARGAMTMVAGQRTLAEAFPDRFLLGMGVSHEIIVEGVRGANYSRPYSDMVAYLDQMDQVPYRAQMPATDPGRVLAALGPKMLKLSAEKANGAHPYFIPPEHTAEARAIVGPDSLVAPEQMVVLETDPTEARRIARTYMSIYLERPNYFNNLRRLGFTEDDWSNGGSDRLVDAIVAWGDEDAIAARVKAHHDAGADHVCIQVLNADARKSAAPILERLAPALLG